ncbi:acetoin utilization protein AcuC [Actinoalloteichus sp. AHMU CJ021]|uniref:acetoin utilization protein AcuC n=1 Tax=Actinoalloteichus sp. AHMU CJ021 TaxID=2072503 RepID=UPI000CA04EDA|nr:acetoin utilization protein AcuC [Actinoalloteichus sp. AHMU CJ021]
MDAVVVWDESYLGYNLGEHHPLNPRRLDLTMRLAGELGLLADVSVLRPPEATSAQLTRVHESGYVEAVRAGRRSVGLRGLGTVDNPVFDGMHEAAALIAGGSLAAARAILDGASRAINIGGGLHHAMPGHAAGFCVYNDCAVAIAWLLDHGVERIAYLDVDVHHGDGVQTAFYDDPRVLTVSVHQHPATLWPGTGRPEELGTGAAEGTSVNLALPPGTGDAGWRRAFEAVVPAALAAFRPQLLVTQCGADTHREDPLADLRLTVDGHRALYRRLRELAETYAEGRWLALGGGGYALARVVPRSWTHLIATVLDRDLAPGTGVPGEWVRYATPFAGGDALPATLSDGVDPGYQPWDGTVDTPVDHALLATRRAVFPLLGLDADDRRD